MTTRTHVLPSDLHGVLKLAADATVTVTDIVEAMHAEIAFPSVLTSPRPTDSTKGLPAVAYSAVRSIATLTGRTIDAAMPALRSRLGKAETTPQRDAYVAVLNGVIGDHLHDTGNPLAIEPQLRRGNAALLLRRDAISASLRGTTPRIAVLVHGLCGHEAQWDGRDADYAALLEDGFGFTVLRARYNSGRHVSDSGQSLSAVLDELVREWPVPVEELLLVGHSMGGLVARSAASAGERDRLPWRALLRRMAFLGSPHHGAPLERGGHWFEQLLGAVPFAGPLARLGRLRSAGVTDLRHGNVAREDWHGSDRFEHANDRRQPVALPTDVDCLAIAATTGERVGDVRDRLLMGDGLVPVSSALGLHDESHRDLGLPESRRAVIPRANHMALLGHPEAKELLKSWLAR